MNKKLRIGTIILIILTVLCLLWGFKLKGKVNTGAKALKDAVYTENGQLDPSNDGKLVVTTGKLSADEYVYDEYLGFTINTICAYRNTEVLHLDYKTDDDDRKDYYLEWKAVHDSDNKLNSDYLFGKASLGDYSIDKTLLKEFKKDSYYDDFKRKELYASYWEYVEDPNGHAYLTAAPTEFTEYGPDYLKRATRYDAEYEGLYRVNYSYVDIDDEATYTLVGIQEDNKLVKSSDIITPVFSSKLSIDQISEKLTKHEKSNAKIPFILALIFGAIAALMLKRDLSD